MEFYIIRLKEGLYLRNRESNYFKDRFWITTTNKPLSARKYKSYLSADKVRIELADFYNRDGYAAITSKFEIVKLTITEEVVG